jgi:hypothetical protein
MLPKNVCCKMSLKPYAGVYGMCSIKVYKQPTTLHQFLVSCDYMGKGNWRKCPLLQTLKDGA